MAYCALSDLEKVIPITRLIELTDDEGVGAVDQDRIDEALAAAQGETDGYLAERYTIPLDPVPALVRAICADLAVYHLYSRVQDEVPEIRRRRYDNAVRLLDKLAGGGISLGTASQPAAANPDTIRVTAPEAVFTDEELDKF